MDDPLNRMLAQAARSWMDDEEEAPAAAAGTAAAAGAEALSETALAAKTKGISTELYEATVALAKMKDPLDMLRQREKIARDFFRDASIVRISEELSNLPAIAAERRAAQRQIEQTRVAELVNGAGWRGFDQRLVDTARSIGLVLEACGDVLKHKSVAGVDAAGLADPRRRMTFASLLSETERTRNCFARLRGYCEAVDRAGADWRAAHARRDRAAAAAARRAGQRVFTDFSVGVDEAQKQLETLKDTCAIWGGMRTFDDLDEPRRVLEPPLLREEDHHWGEIVGAVFATARRAFDVLTMRQRTRRRRVRTLLNYSGYGSADGSASSGESGDDDFDAPGARSVFD